MMISPATGKVFTLDDRFAFLHDDPRVAAACGVL